MSATVPSLPATLSKELLSKLRGIRVMLVDDEPYFRGVLLRMLRHVQITQIVEAGTIAEANALLRKKPVSLVICDYSLPDGTGLDLVAAIRRGEKNRRTSPVLLLSGFLDHTLLRRAINAGVDDCMVKPLRAITLYQRIAALVNRPPVYVDIPGIYFGPDRRRRISEIEAEMDRRKTDAVVARRAGGLLLDEDAASGTGKATAP